MCDWTGLERVRATARLAILVSAAALGAACLTAGCSPSPYRRALAEVDRPGAERLADRLAELSTAHRSALRHMERTNSLLAKTTSNGEKPSHADLDACVDAVDRCRWWMFTLERLTTSLDDLSSGHLADVDPVRAEQAQHLAAEFRKAQKLMPAPVATFALALGTIRLSVETQSSVQPQEATLPDLSALREETQRALEHAKVLSASLRRLTGGTGDRAAVSVDGPMD